MLILFVVAILLLIVNALALSGVKRVLHSLAEDLYDMTQALDDLRAKVEANSSVIDSAVTLINTLAEEIRNNIDDSDALEELANGLDAKSQALAAAVAANTPSTAPVATPPGDATSATPPVEPSPTGEVPTPEAPTGDVSSPPPSNPDE
jgi:hypothetical protein